MTWPTPYTPDQRKANAKARAKRIANQRPPRTLHSAVMGGGTTGPVPKGVTAKPGKGAPTKEEARWMAQIVAHGCIACRLDGHGYVPAEVHHILRGGVRMGHLHTIPLCSGHHRKGAGRPGLTARHPDKARFEEQYGPEEQILGWLRGELARTGEFA